MASEEATRGNADDLIIAGGGTYIAVRLRGEHGSSIHAPEQGGRLTYLSRELSYRFSVS